jgi:hypothetical protein
MNKKIVTAIILTALLLCVAASLGNVSAGNGNGNGGMSIAWLVTDFSGTPLNGATITIYYSASANGPFAPLSASNVQDILASIDRNPIITAGKNPDHDDGIGLAKIKLNPAPQYYYYAQVTYGSKSWYWPTPENANGQSWCVASSGSPTGFVASGNGVGCGVTTAHITRGPPETHTVPEVPFGPVVAAAAMAVGLVAFVKIRKKTL